MRVALIGGTGFIGGYLVDALLERGHVPVVLARPGSASKVRRAPEVDLVQGDLTTIGDLIRLLNNCEAVVYNVGILREDQARGVTFEALQYDGLLRAIEAARVCGVRRLLLMSANGVSETGTAYQDTKYRAERFALSCELQVTVMRPSVVFGDPRSASEFGTQLFADMIAPRRPAVGFFNAFGTRRGEIKMSPVHAKDVADAFSAALNDPSTFGKTYTLAGPERLSWREMLLRIAAVAGRKKWILPMPIELMKFVAAPFDRLRSFPVTRAQLSMLAEGNCASPADITQLTGRAPTAFDTKSLAYLAPLNYS